MKFHKAVLLPVAVGLIVGPLLGAGAAVAAGPDEQTASQLQAVTSHVNAADFKVDLRPRVFYKGSFEIPFIDLGGSPSSLAPGTRIRATVFDHKGVAAGGARGAVGADHALHMNAESLVGGFMPNQSWYGDTLAITVQLDEAGSDIVGLGSVQIPMPKVPDTIKTTRIGDHQLRIEPFRIEGAAPKAQLVVKTGNKGKAGPSVVLKVDANGMTQAATINVAEIGKQGYFELYIADSGRQVQTLIDIQCWTLSQ